MHLLRLVVPHAGTWIEILYHGIHGRSRTVVPHAGTWIEIGQESQGLPYEEQSFPMRERGLKFINTINSSFACSSFPMRERGLKYL